MPMRLSGLVTGMDTEAIVGQLMDAQKAKKKKVTGAKTKLEWKQNIWKDLNTKLKSFYNGSVSKMRLSSSYNVKKAKVSDESKATIDAQPNAVTGSYTMTVDRIASAQFLTSGKTKITSTSQKLSELTDDAGNSLVGKEITVKGPSGTQKLEINADTKVSDLVNTFKNAGLNASFDTTQKKFFISSKTTGEENAFSVTTTTVSQAETDARSALKTAIGFDNMSSANKTIVNNALKTLQTAAVGSDEYTEASSSIAKAVYDTRYSGANSAASNLVKAQIYDEYMSSGQAQDAAAADKSLRAQFYQVEEDGSFKLDDGGNRIPKEGSTADLPADYDAAVAKKAKELAVAYANEHINDDENKSKVDLYTQSGVSAGDVSAVSEDAKTAFGLAEAEGLNGTTEESIAADIADEISAYAAVDSRSDATGDAAVKSLLGLSSVDSSAEDFTDEETGMAYIKAKDSEITLNGAKLTSASSTVSANGLNINLVSLTKPGESVSFSVSNDVDAVYDTIKKTLKEYNDLMKEMNEKYNASSSKGYEPLTTDEKKALSDDEVEEWEKKIKDSLLRRDSTLQGITSSMRTAMMASTTVNGKSYSLSSFGIMTSTNYQEGGLLHIYGDPDDDVYSAEEDKLKKALTDNPDETINALTNIFEQLRSSMFNKMSATEYSSGLTFYNDKQMDKEMSNYKTEIKEWEDKLAAMEDAYFKKFAAMETAMAKLQSQTSSVTGLLGM